MVSMANYYTAHSYVCLAHVGVLLILPFLPFMVSDFFPELDQTEIGKKAGFLGSAYYIGCLGGSFMVSCFNNKSLISCQPLQWGWVGDIVGRRYCATIIISSDKTFSFTGQLYCFAYVPSL